MPADTRRIVDTAVIGGGVSGLYCAWRLATDPRYAGSSIEVFEGSERTGGRLWSITVGEEHAIPAELGGMFFSDAQDLVYRLCSEVLDLKTQAVTPENDFAWLRGKRFALKDFATPGVLPYRLADDEQGLQAHEIILLALRRIVPGIESVWPLNPHSNLAETVGLLRTSTFEGVPLAQWGFWNLLARVISNEARECLGDIEGSYAIYSNWNGLEAVFSILSDLTGRWHRLPDGYEQLPRALRQRAEAAGARVHLHRSLQRLGQADSEGLRRLEFAGEEGDETVYARRVILTLPAGALQRLQLTASTPYRQALQASAGVPAAKIFLAFENPWWQDVPMGPGRIESGHFGASHTDLPMRQCYYLGQDACTGQALLLGSFGDMRSVNFWPTLLDPGKRDRLLTRPLPARMQDELQRQLRDMHNVDIPTPVDGAFIDWSQAPYWAGWHAWKPGVESWQVSALLRASPQDPGLHVCGESYSAWQGWVEGALTSAEALLTDTLEVTPLPWLDGSHCLAPYRA